MRLCASLSFAFALVGLQTTVGAAGNDSLGPDGEFRRSVVVNYGEEHVFCVTNLSKSTAVESLSVSAEYSWWEGGTNRTGTLTLTEKTTTYDADNLITGFFALLTDMDWESVPRVEETGKLTFSCRVSGHYDSKTSNNNKFTFGHSAGRGGYPKELPHGMSEGDPIVLRPSTESRSASCDGSSRYCRGDSYFSANLSAEHKYMFGLEGTNDLPMVMYRKGETNDLFATADSYTNWTDCVKARAFVPEQDGTYVIWVGCGTNLVAVRHATMPFRKPAQHPHGEISTVSPAIFVPGYLNDPESGAFDNVIDQELFAFSNYNKGDCLQFSAAFTDMTRAITNLLMRLYDSSGKALGENRWAGGGEIGRVVWAATSAGSSSKPLYIGVCQDLAKGEQTNAVGTVRLAVSRVELVERTSVLTAIPDSQARSPVNCPESASKVRQLGPTEWSNVFALPARAGITYRIKAGLTADGKDNGYKLTAMAYTLSGTTKKPLAVNLVKDPAAINPNAAGWWEIHPDANATVYIEVSVADGPWGSGDGLAYGPYRLYATGAYAEGEGPGELGLLKADMGGAYQADMGWKIISGPAVAGIVASKESYYPAGSAVILPVGGAYAVAAKSISGFAKVNAKGYDVSVYVEKYEDAKKVVSAAKEFRYFDTADPLDDGPDTKAKELTTGRSYKPTKISPTSGKAMEVSRSLWNAYEDESYRDTVDWFTVSAKEGAFYRFSLPWASDEQATEVRVYGPNDWTDECDYNVFTNPKDSVRISAEKGTYYIRVANDRPGSSTNCAYRLRTLMTTPGTVKFSKNAITVKDTDAYADITVNRTGKDGRIRVKYYTVAGAAQPGKDYYPVPKSEPAVLVWENGDNKAKKVRIKLIPDIVTVPIGVTKRFEVRFETYGWDEVDPENEYVPRFDSKMGDTVTVSISETKKKSAGTVQVTCDNPKKPVFDVVAGETLVIPFERVSGTNGIVGVAAVTAKGTANKSGETDYESAAVTNVWENGVGGPGGEGLVIRTMRNPSDYTAKKTFTVKLTALTSKKGDAVQYAKPALAAKTVSVNILNDKFARTMSDWAKSKAFPSGVTGVKESKPGTWFCADALGEELWSVNAASVLSFSLSGPGRFTYEAEEAGGTVTNWIRSGKQTLKISGVTHIRSWDYVQLPAVTPDVPSVDGAVVKEGIAELRFAPVAGGAEKGIAYRVYALSAGSGMKLGDAATEIAFDGSYRTNVWYDAINKGKWTWRVDSFFVGGTVTNGPKKAWSFTVADDSKLPPGASIAETKVSGSDAYGNPLDIVGGDHVVLHRLVKADFAVGAPGSKVAKVSGGVPKGLSLKSVKQANGLAQYFLVGTPTKAGKYLVVLQETSDKVKGTTTALAITVEDAGHPEGTFNGLAAVGSNDAVGQYRQSIAKITFTASSSGKLSAKALIGGKTYSFADTGYERVRTNEEGRVTLEAVLTQSQKVKQNGVQTVFVNELRMAVLEGETDDASLWTLSEPELRLTMRALPDLQGEGFARDVDYFGTLLRDNTKTKKWVSAAAGFSGYYTVALVPDTQTGGWTNNVPNGNGYLTMTLDAKGKAKVGGALADGASFSASMPVAFGETNGETSVVLPLYAAKNKSVLAGWTGIRFPCGQAPKEPVTGSWTDDVPIVQAFGDEGVVWFNDDSNATYDGKFGYGIGIRPVGGWYDKVVNLQRHYIGGVYDHVFEVDKATVDELWQISDLIRANVGEGYDLAANALPYGQSVDLAVNNFIVDKQSLVKDSTKTYYVWDACVNPANVKLTFKRATGILTGTCCIWYEGLNAKGALTQKYYSNCKHAGVFLMCRDADDLLPEDTVTAGALVIPQTIKLPNGSKRKWNANFRFNVRSAWNPKTWED